MFVTSGPISLGIYEINDVVITIDCQFLIVSYTSGTVNLHNLADGTYNYVL